MTICISAVCEEEKKAVVVIDRMITSPALAIEFEQHLCKIDQLSKTCVITSAGDALDPKDIFRNSKAKVDQLTRPTIRQISDILKEEFISCRKRNVEDQLLKPRGFDDLDEFYGRMRELPPDVYSVIDNRIERFHELYDTSMAIVVTGIDYLGAHIYLVFDPGRTKCFDSIGFHAVGSGTPHAISLFTSYDYTNRFPLNLAIWVAYEAKRRAERAPGVGKETDICILDNKGMHHLSEEVLTRLNEAYEQKERQGKDWLEGLPDFTS